jgi:transposase
MYLKRRTREKDGKTHVYYAVCESLRVSAARVVQRTVLHLGELNTTQVDRWQHTIEVLHEDGQRHQLRLFTDREGPAPAQEDVVEVRLGSFSVRQPRRFGDCWVGTQLWEQLGLRAFWEGALAQEAGQVSWHKVLELLVVNRLLAPRSELFVHEKWFGHSAMDLLLDTDASVADKDRLYRCLDRLLEHKEELEKHLAAKWRDLFGATYDVLLYDLTSTYFEGALEGVPKAQRGYSRDHRPDCKQLVIALLVSPEGFPLSYEVFGGNRRDVTTLQEIVEAVERKHGQARRVWVFDRGIVSEANLKWLRERGAHYLVGTPRSALKAREKALLEGSWRQISDQVQVQLVGEGKEVYVLCRSSGRRDKEAAMRRRRLLGLMRGLVKLRRQLRHHRIGQEVVLQRQLGRLQERYATVWKQARVQAQGLKLDWDWDREALRLAAQRDGAYLLRAHWTEQDPQRLWEAYVQLTEAEAAFRTLKSEIKIRPIWHWLAHRVEAHVLVAFLGYCLWVCLKHRLRAVAPSLTPWQALDQLGRISLVEVWFQLKDQRWLCLPRITQPEPVQAVLLDQLGWRLPEQPPPRIHAHQIPHEPNPPSLNCVADLDT